MYLDVFELGYIKRFFDWSHNLVKHSKKTCHAAGLEIKKPINDIPKIN